MLVLLGFFDAIPESFVSSEVLWPREHVFLRCESTGLANSEHFVLVEVVTEQKPSCIEL